MKPHNLFLFAAFLFSSVLARCQWTQTNGPDGGGVYDFAEQNGKLYAATFSGVYASGDQGASWTLSGLQGIDFYRILAGNNSLFAAAYDSLYRSTDNGVTWEKIWDSPGIRIQAMTAKGIDLFLSVYASDTAAGGVYRSSDDGTTWNKISYDTRFMQIRGLVVSGDCLIAMSRTGMIFRTTNNGANWTEVNVADPFGVTTAKVNGNRIVVAGSRGIHYSTDQGASWNSPANAGLMEYELFYDVAVQGNTAIATSFISDTVFRSTNLGQSWMPLPAMSKMNPIYRVETINGKMFCGSWMGLLSSNDAGLNWQPSFSGMHTSEAEVAVYENALFASTGYGVFRSTDDGANWGAPSAASLPFSVTGKFLTIDGDLYVVNEDGMYRWSSGSWVSASTHSIGEIVSDGTTWYGSVDGDIQISTDKGVTWSLRNSGLPPAEGSTFIGPNILRSNGILLTRVSTIDEQSFTRSDMIYRSSNDGETWQMVYIDTNYNDLVDFGAYGSHFFASTYGNGLLRSSDDGRTWQKDQSFPSDVCSDIFIYGRVFVSALDRLMVASDDVTTWQSAPTPLGQSVQMAANGTTMYAGVAFNGIWKHPLASLDVNVATSTAAAMMVTPNPFEDRVTISFVLEEPSDVSLRLQDIHGRTVRILYEGYLAPTQHSISVDNVDIQPGFYNVQLQTGQGKKTMKVIRIK
jgi:photosystem II stability/assembly factor-like uncharacterized protein